MKPTNRETETEKEREREREEGELNPGVGGNPVGRFTVIITLPDPLSEPLALHRVMPVLTAAETTHIHAHIHAHIHIHTRTHAR